MRRERSELTRPRRLQRSSNNVGSGGLEGEGWSGEMERRWRKEAVEVGEGVDEEMDEEMDGE